MLNLYRSYRANSLWVRAHAEMGGQVQGIALVTIRKAIDLEPNIKKIPEYLELQGHIESSLGKFKLAIHSFERALNIISEGPDIFNTEGSKELTRRLHQAMEEISKKKK